MKYDFESIALEAIALTELEFVPESDRDTDCGPVAFPEHLDATGIREFDLSAYPELSRYLGHKRAAIKNADECDRCMLWFPSGHVDGNTCQCVSCSHDGAFDNPVRGVEGRDQVLPT